MVGDSEGRGFRARKRWGRGGDGGHGLWGRVGWGLGLEFFFVLFLNLKYVFLKIKLR